MKKLSLLIAMCAVSIFAIGCTNDQNSGVNTDAGSGGNAPSDSHDDHDHADHGAEGPNGGQIIELGRDHEFHAELVHDDDKGTVTIYMLDGDMKPNSIDEATISLTLTVGDDTQLFDLASSGENNSQFTSDDMALISMIDAEGVEGKLRATIGGKPYAGTISHHDHDH